jgi:hypothetical protein
LFTATMTANNNRAVLNVPNTTINAKPHPSVHATMGIPK